MMVFMFVVSSVICINYFVKVLAIISGKEMSVPAPIIHIAGWGFSNTYLTTPAIGYQVYFWSYHFGLFTVV